MAWSDWLAPEERVKLIERFGTFEEAAAAAISDPRWADECAELGVKMKTPATTDHRGRRVPPRIQMPQEVEDIFQLTVKEMLEEPA